MGNIPAVPAADPGQNAPLYQLLEHEPDRSARGIVIEALGAQPAATGLHFVEDAFSSRCTRGAVVGWSLLFAPHAFGSTRSLPGRLARKGFGYLKDFDLPVELLQLSRPDALDTELRAIADLSDDFGADPNSTGSGKPLESQSDVHSFPQGFLTDKPHIAYLYTNPKYQRGGELVGLKPQQSQSELYRRLRVSESQQKERPLVPDNPSIVTFVDAPHHRPGKVQRVDGSAQSRNRSLIEVRDRVRSSTRLTITAQ